MSTTTDFAIVEGGPLVRPETLDDTIGWTLKPEGLCRDDSCVPVRDTDGVRQGDLVDLASVAALLDRPVAHDEASGLVAVGAPREHRRAALDLRAPDFTLPDLDGTPHALSDHRSKKRLLVAFSSW